MREDHISIMDIVYRIRHNDLIRLDNLLSDVMVNSIA